MSGCPRLSSVSYLTATLNKHGKCGQHDKIVSQDTALLHWSILSKRRVEPALSGSSCWSPRGECDDAVDKGATLPPRPAPLATHNTHNSHVSLLKRNSTKRRLAFVASHTYNVLGNGVNLSINNLLHIYIANSFNLVVKPAQIWSTIRLRQDLLQLHPVDLISLSPVSSYCQTAVWQHCSPHHQLHSFP